MDIEHKKIYGKLIEHYREEYQQKYGSDQWGIDQFLHIKGKYDRICSRTTYYHMRTDRTVNDQIYIDLIRNLGLKYKEFPMIDNALEGVFLELHSSVLKMENDNLLRLREQINSLFAEARKYFYYNDVYKLLIFLIELHTDRLRDYSLEEREHLSNVSFILSNFDFNLILYSKLIYIVNYTKNYQHLDILFNELSLCEDTSDPLVLYCLLYKYYNTNQLELGNQVLNKIYSIVPESNICLLFRVKLQELFYVYNFDSSRADDAYLETYNYVKEHSEIPKRLLKSYHYNYAMYLFSNYRYDEAINTFEEYFKVTDTFNVYAESNYAMCHVLTKKKIKREYDLDSFDDSNVWPCILKYCVLKENNDIEELFGIMEKEIIPNCFKDLPSILLEFVQKETLWLTEVTKKYKILKALNIKLIDDLTK